MSSTIGSVRCCEVFGFFDTLHAMEASGRGHEAVEGEDDATGGSAEGAQAG